MPCRLILTETFERAALTFLTEVGRESDAASALAAHLERLASYDWDDSLDIRQISGDTFALQFHPRFRFTFKRRTARTPRTKKVTRIELYLKTIEHTRR